MAIQRFALDLTKLEALAREVFDATLTGHPTPESEGALVMCYLCIADGVKLYPPQSASARRYIAFGRASEALAKVVTDVGAMTETDVRRELDRRSAGTGGLAHGTETTPQ